MSLFNLDRSVWDAKERAVKAVLRLSQERNPTTPEEMMHAVEDLHRAWDELSVALHRQRDERDRQIRRLLDELAERPPRG